MIHIKIFEILIHSFSLKANNFCLIETASFQYQTDTLIHALLAKKLACIFMVAGRTLCVMNRKNGIPTVRFWRKMRSTSKIIWIETFFWLFLFMFLVFIIEVNIGF